MTEARVALVRKQYAQAERLANQIDTNDPNRGAAMLVAGEAATRAGNIDRALEHYQSVPRDGSKTALVAVFSAAELQRDLGRLSEALHLYLYCIQQQPENVNAHLRLAFLYGVTGRRWESLPHFEFLLRHDQLTLDSIALLGDLERPVEQPEYVKLCYQNARNDVLVTMARGAEAFADGQSAEARRLLQNVVDRQADLVAAQSMLGELLVDADAQTFRNWHSQLPAVADSYADIWYVRGLRARREGHLRNAARCFWETIRLVPVHRRGIYQLGQVLVALGDPAGKEFSNRSSVLFDLTHQLDLALKSEGRDVGAVRKIIELMESSGRLWEARAWAKLAGDFYPQANWPAEETARLEQKIDEKTPTTIDSANLALRLDFSKWPDHREIFTQDAAPSDTGAKLGGRSTIKFNAATAGAPEFSYFNGADPLKEEVAVPEAVGGDDKTKTRTRIRIQNRTRMFEQGGGGVGIIDFDGYRRPDLCFPQGAPWKHGSQEPSLDNAPPDSVFRNVAGTRYEDVTILSRLADHGFGQGCSVGDFDNDGFPDIYVANVGRNRLHRNNGDGTFSDVTEASGIDGTDWTASCVIVDLNADGLPDLFDVTYLTGPTVYEAVCNGHACSPKVFDGIPDRLRINRGDGTFELMPDATPAVDSKGLGVVAFDMLERGRPCLFIANDQVPDYLLRNSAAADSTFNVRLSDEGFSSGLAYNEDGLAMASMGIAADDVNGDGRVDFFVSNFKDEYDILYLQDAPGLFVDASNAAGLRAATLPFVGWGTQFLDADCNGDMDLVLTNGHVDDYRPEGGEYHMRPQFFQNVGKGRFVERMAPGVGDYFAGKYLGRGLARLDWNGDGRMDFVVSNIADPASLVTNQSTNVGHYVNLRLHATQTARDAIGAVVEVMAGDRRWSKQLMAGDGYMASNERLLQFGIGDAQMVDQIKIAWPSGGTTQVLNIVADATLELVEGSRWGTVSRDAELSSLTVEPGK